MCGVFWRRGTSTNMTPKPLTSNATGLVTSLDGLLIAQRALSSSILEQALPPPGPYALFHHHGLLLERLENLRLLITRIGEARYRTIELAHGEEQYRPRVQREGRPLSKRLSAVMRESSDLTRQMRMDAESLYIFANLTLDQWAFVIAYGLGLPEPTRYRYSYLVDQLQGARTLAALQELKQAHLTDAIWLLYQVRWYRNAFIEHVERPWQRGSTMGVYQEDFNFFITTPVGWIAPDEERRLVDGIKHLAPDWVKQLPADHWQAKPRAVLEATYREIDRISAQVDRQAVWTVWQQLGGSTVSFDRLARRLLDFLTASTATMQGLVAGHPEAVNLGPPAHTTTESS